MTNPIPHYSKTSLDEVDFVMMSHEWSRTDHVANVQVLATAISQLIRHLNDHEGRLVAHLKMVTEHDAEFKALKERVAELEHQTRHHTHRVEVPHTYGDLLGVALNQEGGDVYIPTMPPVKWDLQEKLVNVNDPQVREAIERNMPVDLDYMPEDINVAIDTLNAMHIAAGNVENLLDVKADVDWFLKELRPRIMKGRPEHVSPVNFMYSIVGLISAHYESRMSKGE
jgi:hypothetical protein